jgi:Bacteriodetes cell division protein (FtsL-like)
MNKEKQKAPEPIPVKAKKKSNNMTFARKYVKLLNVFGIFGKESLVNVMPYVFFLTVIALVYIANSYHAERTIRDIDNVSKEIKTLQTEYITGKSELMFVSKQTEVARLVAPLEIKESVEAPMKIVVNTEKSKKEN